MATLVDLEPVARPTSPSTSLPRPPAPLWVTLVTQALFTFAVGALGLFVFLLVITPIQQNNAQDRLYASYRYQLADDIAPTGGAIAEGTPVALINIPGLGLDEVVVQGTASGDLQTGPGHLVDTPLPGQAGSSYVYGKAVTFGAPFAQIDRLRAGDRITVTTGEGTFTYRVRDVRRAGDPMPPAVASNGSRLVLETSTGSNPLSQGNTVVVDADLLGMPAATPSGTVLPLPPEDAAMAVDLDATIPLVLWLQALGMLLAGVVWARRYWGRAEALLVGVPLVLAVVWNVYETVAQLLPNLV